jgi:hypothetical protein
VPLTVEFRNPGSVTPITSQTVFLNASNQFEIQSLLGGDYDVAMKAPHWLREVLHLPAGGGPLAFSLYNGDVNGDNVVNLVDFSLLSSAFRAVPGDPHWNPDADLNGDNVVNLLDFAILSSNFRRQGDP